MLHVISKDQAVACVRKQMQTQPARTTTIALQNASGYILSQDILSAEDIPAFDRSTVDGFAVCAADTFGAGASLPCELEIIGEIAMGDTPAFTLRRGQCARISTGGMLPTGADAAVMVEHTDTQERLCLVFQGVSPGANVTRRGDDIGAGACALKKGTRLGAAEIGVLAALGVYEVPVFQKPVVAVISTGDELVTGTPKDGQMRDVNSFLLCAALEKSGCEARMIGAIKDQKEQIRAALTESLKTADMVLLSGGSSAGAKDMTVELLQELGEVCFHGIAIKPGKPTIFGTVQDKPVFGLPGHPLAAYFVFRLIVTQALRERLHLPEDRPKKTAKLSVNIPSNHGREEYLCVKLLPDGTAVPLHTKSGIISVLTQADGFLCIPRDAEGLQSGSMIDIYEVEA